MVLILANLNPDGLEMQPSGKPPSPSTGSILANLNPDGLEMQPSGKPPSPSAGSILANLNPEGLEMQPSGNPHHQAPAQSWQISILMDWKCNPQATPITKRRLNPGKSQSREIGTGHNAVPPPSRRPADLDPDESYSGTGTGRHMLGLLSSWLMHPPAGSACACAAWHPQVPCACQRRWCSCGGAL